MTLPANQGSQGCFTAAGISCQLTPATGALDGQADLRGLSPATLHTALAAAPLSGRISAQTDGDAVRFQADIRAATAAPAAPAVKASNTAATARPGSVTMRGTSC